MRIELCSDRILNREITLEGKSERGKKEKRKGGAQVEGEVETGERRRRMNIDLMTCFRDIPGKSEEGKRRERRGIFIGHFVD